MAVALYFCVLADHCVYMYCISVLLYYCTSVSLYICMSVLLEYRAHHHLTTNYK